MHNKSLKAGDARDREWLSIHLPIVTEWKFIDYVLAR